MVVTCNHGGLGYSPAKALRRHRDPREWAHLRSGKEGKGCQASCVGVQLGRRGGVCFAIKLASCYLKVRDPRRVFSPIRISRFVGERNGKYNVQSTYLQEVDSDKNRRDDCINFAASHLVLGRFQL
jgi:hypothetical protein